MNKVIIRVVILTIVFLLFVQHAVVFAGINPVTISNLNEWKNLKIKDADGVSREMVYKFQSDLTNNNVKYGLQMQFFDIGYDGSIYRASDFGER